MYYELTGIPIQKLITIMVTPNGEIKVYDKETKVITLNYWLNMSKLYRKQNGG